MLPFFIRSKTGSRARGCVTRLNFEFEQFWGGQPSLFSILDDLISHSFVINNTLSLP